MINLKRKRLIELEAELNREKESLDKSKGFYLSAKEKVEEIEALICFYKNIVLEADKELEREDYKKKVCRKCELGQYGDCMAEIEDVLECKTIQKRLDKQI